MSFLIASLPYKQNHIVGLVALTGDPIHSTDENGEVTVDAITFNLINDSLNVTQENMYFESVELQQDPGAIMDTLVISVVQNSPFRSLSSTVQFDPPVKAGYTCDIKFKIYSQRGQGNSTLGKISNLTAPRICTWKFF